MSIISFLFGPKQIPLTSEKFGFTVNFTSDEILSFQGENKSINQFAPNIIKQEAAAFSIKGTAKHFMSPDKTVDGDFLEIPVGVGLKDKDSNYVTVPLADIVKKIDIPAKALFDENHDFMKFDKMKMITRQISEELTAAETVIDTQGSLSVAYKLVK